MDGNIENKGRFSSIVPYLTPLHKKTIISALGVLVLTLGLATGVVLVQNQQTFQSLATCYDCPGGTCPDGWSYGPDSCSLQSCGARQTEACASHQGGGGGSGDDGDSQYCAICDPNGDCECIDGAYSGMECKYAPDSCSNLGNTWQPDGSCPAGQACGSQGPPPPPGDPNVCETEGITSSGCYGVAVNGACTLGSGYWCDKTGVNDDGDATCACRPPTESTTCSSPNFCSSSNVDCVSGGGTTVAGQTCSGSQVCCFTGSSGGQLPVCSEIGTGLDCDSQINPAPYGSIACNPANALPVTYCCPPGKVLNKAHTSCETDTGGGQCAFPACGDTDAQDCRVGTKTITGGSCDYTCGEGRTNKCIDASLQRSFGDEYLFTCCKPPAPPPTGNACEDAGYECRYCPPFVGSWVIGDEYQNACTGFFDACCDTGSVKVGQGQTTINDVPITVVATLIMENMNKPITPDNKDADLNNDSVINGVDWAILSDKARQL